MKTKAIKTALLIILLSVFVSVANAQEQKNHLLYYERVWPNDSIPADSYKGALDQQWDMRQNVGYGIAPQTAV